MPQVNKKSPPTSISTIPSAEEKCFQIKTAYIPAVKLGNLKYTVAHSMYVLYKEGTPISCLEFVGATNNGKVNIRNISNAKLTPIASITTNSSLRGKKIIDGHTLINTDDAQVITHKWIELFGASNEKTQGKKYRILTNNCNTTFRAVGEACGYTANQLKIQGTWQLGFNRKLT